MTPSPKFNSTTEYCGLEKVGMADMSFSCSWPRVPEGEGGECTMTWIDYVGPNVTISSNVLFSLYFGVGFFVSCRMQWFVHTRLKAKNISWSKRTVNEWLSFYMFVVTGLRLTMELGFGNTTFLSFQVQYVFQKVIAGLLLISPFTLTWGWYKVRLQPSEKRAKGKRAGRIHLIGCVSTLLLEIVTGILGTVLLPDDYKDAGVYVGNANAACRIIEWFYLAFVGRVCVKMGRGIEESLRRGSSVGKRDKNEKLNKKEIKQAAKKGKEEAKISILVNRAFIVIVITLLYFVYDIYSSVGKLRHVTPPLCKASSVFVRLPTFCHIMVTFTVLHYFGVKDPAKKNKGKVSPSGASTRTTTSIFSKASSTKISSAKISSTSASDASMIFTDKKTEKISSTDTVVLMGL